MIWNLFLLWFMSLHLAVLTSFSELWDVISSIKKTKISKQCRKFTIVRKEIGIVWCQLKTQIARNKVRIVKYKVTFICIFIYAFIYLFFIYFCDGSTFPYNGDPTLHSHFIDANYILHNHKCKNIILRAVNLVYYTKTLIQKSSIMPIFIEIIKFDFDMQWIL